MTSPEIAEFQVLYDDIQRMIGSVRPNPKRIIFLYYNKSEFAKRCQRIEDILGWLKRTNDFYASHVIEDVEPKFVSKMRHYKRDLQPMIGWLCASTFLVEHGLINETEARSLSGIVAKWAIQGRINYTKSFKL